MPIRQVSNPPLRSQGLTQAAYSTQFEAFMTSLPLAIDDLNAAGSAYALATNATSTTSNSISVASKSFTTQINLGYQVGQTVRIATNSTNFMTGEVTSYNTGTGALVVNVTSVTGTGTFTSWFISQAAVGANTASGVTNTPAGNIAGTTVQAALNELDSEKAGLATNNTFTGTNAFNGNTTIGDAGADTATLNAQLSAGGGVGASGEFLKSRGTSQSPIWEAVATVPSGTILPFGGSGTPAGYLVCPTAVTNVSRTTYSALFSAIGTTWGAGDGSTTFGIPFFPADYALVQNNANLGSNHVGANLSHTHTAYQTVAGIAGGVAGLSTESKTTPTVVNTGSSGGSANLAAGSRVAFIVKF
jgi:hypothetical protein